MQRQLETIKKAIKRENKSSDYSIISDNRFLHVTIIDNKLIYSHRGHYLVVLSEWDKNILKEYNVYLVSKDWIMSNQILEFINKIDKCNTYDTLLNIPSRNIIENIKEEYILFKTIDNSRPQMKFKKDYMLELYNMLGVSDSPQMHLNCSNGNKGNLKIKGEYGVGYISPVSNKSSLSSYIVQEDDNNK